MHLNGLNKVLSNKNIYKFVVASLMLHVFNSSTATTEVLTIKKKENKFEILAAFESSTNVCSTWKLITSYENLPSFLPRMVSSKILKNEGNKKVVRQVFKDNLFIFPLHVKNNFSITEYKADKKIIVKFLSGDLNDYYASWKITNIAGKTFITINALITPSHAQRIFLSNKKIYNHFNEMINSLKNKLISVHHSHDC